MQTENLLKFLNFIHKLKQTKRQGWLNNGIPKENCESVCDHMYRMALMVLFLENDRGMDLEKCLRMALVHDLQECIVGDITPEDGITKEEKFKRELDAVKELQKLLPHGQSFYDLWMEYEENKTKESKYVHALDKLEMVLQASEYESTFHEEEESRSGGGSYGCFDLTHFGHFNALRQAKDLCEFLVVGCHSDEEIERNKGKPVLSMKERVGILEGCSFVDLVVPNAPYYTSIEWLDKYECEVCVHGDDVTTTADGTDCYAEVKLAKRYVECKRTIGISTTDLVQRVLLSSSSSSFESFESSESGGVMMYSVERIIDFGLHKRLNGNLSDSKIVLCVGVFDVFNYSHVELLKGLRERNSDKKIVVGLIHYSDAKKKKKCFLGLYERLLSLLSCRYVDDVIVLSIRGEGGGDEGGGDDETKEKLLSEEFVENVAKVVVVAASASVSAAEKGDRDVADIVLRGIDKIKEVEEVTVLEEFNTQSIVDRILGNRKLYEDRNRRKMEKQRLEREMEEKEKLKKKKQSK